MFCRAKGATGAWALKPVPSRERGEKGLTVQGNRAADEAAGVNLHLSKSSQLASSRQPSEAPLVLEAVAL